jgi:predicted RNase H-like HicB family nuclease
LDELKQNMREAIELVIESTRKEAEKQRCSNKMTVEVSI